MRAGFLALLALSCSLSPVDYVGKTCPDGRCPGTLVCFDSVCQLEGFDAGRADAGATDAGAQVKVVTADFSSDTAMWSGGHESLHTSFQTLQVGPGTTTNSIAGARFQPQLPRGAQLIEVVLQLARVDGSNKDTTFTVFAWNSIAVAPFSETHVHAAAEHDPAGALATTVIFTPTLVPVSKSADLSAMLQPLVSRADWSDGAVIGFFVMADNTDNTWASFADATFPLHSFPPPQLVITFSNP